LDRVRFVYSVFTDINQLHRINTIFYFYFFPSNTFQLVCAGTGHAPFRGFVQERRFLLDQQQQSSASASSSASAPLLAEAHLFFGCRRRDLDWIYRDEMEAAAKDGVVTSLELAFSREPVSFVGNSQSGLSSGSDILFGRIDAAFVNHVHDDCPLRSQSGTI
jgi:hypothetical protein